MLENQIFPAAEAAAGLQWGVGLSLAAIWHGGAGSTVTQSVHESCHWHSPLWHRNWLGKLCLAMECSVAVAALGSCQWHRPLTSSEGSRKCPSGASCFLLQGSSFSQGWSVAGCKLAQKVENKNLWHGGTLLWELSSRELKIARVLLVYPGSRVACVLWSVRNYRSRHDFCSVCSLLITDDWLENSAQGCEWAVQRLTKAGGYLRFSQKEKKPVSEAVQMLMPSYVLLYWATEQILLRQDFFLYIYLLIFKCLK